MRENSDAELLAATRDGNKVAFGYLVERYQHMTERVAQRMVGNAYIAQELAQEAFLQAYLSLDRLRNDGRFAGWFYGQLKDDLSAWFEVTSVPQVWARRRK